MKDFHGSERKVKNLDRRLKKLKKSNGKVLKKYMEHLKARGLSDARVLSYVEAMLVIARESEKDLVKLNRKDIEKIVANIEKKIWTPKGKSPREISEGSKQRYKLSIKKFYQWFEGYDWDSKEYPNKVRWIKTMLRKNRLKRPVIMTKEEVLKMFKATKGTREKSMCAFMYESGCRTDELLRLKICDIEFDEYGAKVQLTSGKVGTRTIRIVSCVPRLKAWLEEHPNNIPSNWLWCWYGDSKPIGYQILKKNVNKWKNKANIKKKITPYSFRRSRATHVSRIWGHGTMCKFFGWTTDTKVISRYVNLDDKAQDDAILSYHGLIPKGSGQIKARWCSKCGKQNNPEDENCSACHGALTEKARIECDKKKRLEKEMLFREMVEAMKQELMG